MSKILVALSGGVDSSVAAALLKKQGYQLVGVFLKFWTDPTCKIGRENACCNKESLESARLVCEKLDIPFYVFDVKKEFKKEIVDYFIHEYEAGRTPNPCVICNKKIKFGWLLEKAKKLGCDYIATGHYAHIACETRNSKLEIRNKTHKLLKAKDNKKDQTYFLWQLDQAQLSKIIFPLGNYTKSQVREMAKKFALPTYAKKESQDICFISSGIKEFLAKYIKSKTGKIVDTKGNVLGKHKGLCFYTVGQREGLGIYRPVPTYVVKLNIEKNELVVGDEQDLYSKKVNAKSLNFITKTQKGYIYKAKIRYGAQAQICKINKLNNDFLEVEFKKPIKAVTLGQSIVIYKNKDLIGGGII